MPIAEDNDSAYSHWTRQPSALRYRRTGQREPAQEHLNTAMTMYREMGMTYWLEKAEDESKEHGA